MSHEGIDLDYIDFDGLADHAGELGNVNTESAVPLSEQASSRPLADLLMDKIVQAESFLTFSNQIDEINRIMGMKYSSARDVAGVLAQDVGLITKLLKLVNSSFYGSFSRKGVSTLSEATIVLGTEEVKQAAANLKLFELMQQGAGSKALKIKTLDAFMRSMLAREIALKAGVTRLEEVRVCAMFKDLGGYLVLMFSPNTYLEIEVDAEEDWNDDGRERVSRRVLGMTYSEFGQRVAGHWGFPKRILQSMAFASPLAVRPKDTGSVEMITHICNFAKALCDLYRRGLGDNFSQELTELVVRYGTVLDIGVKDSREIMDLCKKRIRKHAALLNVSSDILEGNPLTGTMESHRVEVQKRGLGKVTELLESGGSIHKVLKAVVETLYSTSDFTRVCLMVKNLANKTMDARFAVGENPADSRKRFCFKMTAGDDIFNRSLSAKEDAVVEDVQGYQGEEGSIPGWFQDLGGLRGFALFPVVVESNRVALLYVDWDRSNTPSKENLFQAGRFRDVVVRAFTAVKRS